MAKKLPELPHITPALRSMAVEMERLVLDPANARKHGQKNLDAIKGSLSRFGQRVPLVVNSRTNIIEKGNGTFLAARALGWTHIAVVDVDDDPLQAAGFAIADNRAGELAEWDYNALGPQLEALSEGGFDLDSIGLDVADVEEALNLWRGLGESDEDEGSGEKSDGSLLALANVAIGEPEHQVAAGDVWHLGNHVLVCADVLTQWERWTGLLQPGDILAPYPGPMVPLTKKAGNHRLVMVQPDGYIAGHILDQWDKVHTLEGGLGAARKAETSGK
jgi:hypothetical protein